MHQIIVTMAANDAGQLKIIVTNPIKVVDAPSAEYGVRERAALNAIAKKIFDGTEASPVPGIVIANEVPPPPQLKWVK